MKFLVESESVLEKKKKRLHINRNAGDVQKGMSIFNHMMGTETDGGTGVASSGEGMGEKLQKTEMVKVDMGKTAKLKSKKLTEEYGPYKDEPFCDEIADALDSGNEFGYVDQERWDVYINGKDSTSFECDEFYDYLLYEISYPVKDGHLKYLDLDINIYSRDYNDVFDKDAFRHDLQMLGVYNKESFNRFYSEDDFELELWIEYNIDFDVDKYERNNEKDIDLPKEVNVSIYDIDYVDGETDNDELSDMLSDYLSDTYGFTHFGFDFDMNGDTIHIYNIEWDIDEALKEGLEFINNEKCIELLGMQIKNHIDEEMLESDNIKTIKLSRRDAIDIFPDIEEDVHWYNQNYDIEFKLDDHYLTLDGDANSLKQLALDFGVGGFREFQDLENENTELCDWCWDEYDKSQLKDTDLGLLCDKCIKAIKSRGEKVVVY